LVSETLEVILDSMRGKALMRIVRDAVRTVTRKRKLFNPFFLWMDTFLRYDKIHPQRNSGSDKKVFFHPHRDSSTI
jgi:hypothetical protein